MADRRILTLLTLLYELCQDVLEDFLETTNFPGRKLNDSTLTSYIEEHASNMYSHMKNYMCHFCLSSKNLCIPFDKEQFMSFFDADVDTEEDIQTLPYSSFSVKPLRVDELNVLNLQYLILASSTVTENQHQWLINIYEQRCRISKLNWDDPLDDFTFNSIWKEVRSMILNFARVFRNRQRIKTVKHQLEYLKTADLKYERAKRYCHLMETEFNIEVIYKRRECFDQQMNIQAETVFFGNNSVQVGNNNVQLQMFPKEIQKKLLDGLEGQREVIYGQREVSNGQKEILIGLRDVQHGIQQLEQGQKVMMDRIENIAIIEKIKRVPENDNDGYKMEGVVDGVQQDDLMAEKSQTVEWNLGMQNEMVTEESCSKISDIKNVDSKGRELINIKSVKMEPLIIETSITEELIMDENGFYQAAHQFLQQIIDACNINTSIYSCLEVEINIREAKESINRTCTECAEKDKLIQTQDTKLAQLNQAFEEKDTQVTCTECTEKDKLLQEQDTKLALVNQVPEEKDVDTQMTCIACAEKDKLIQTQKTQLAMMSQIDTRNGFENQNEITHQDGQEDNSALAASNEDMLDPEVVPYRKQEEEVFNGREYYITLEKSPTLLWSPASNTDNPSKNMDSANAKIDGQKTKSRRAFQRQNTSPAYSYGINVEQGQTHPRSRTTSSGDQTTIDLGNTFSIKKEFKKIRQIIENFLRWRPKRETLFLKKYIKASIFGSSLEELCKNEQPGEVFIPNLIKKCVDAIERRGLRTPDIYTKHCSIIDVHNLRYQIEQVQYDLDSTKWTVHTIADTLLHFLMEMDGPLLPSSLFDAWLMNTCMIDENRLKEAIEELPCCNRKTFSFLISHFKRVVSHRSGNKIDVENIAGAVAPSLFQLRCQYKHKEWHSPTTVGTVEKATAGIVSFCIVENNFIADT